MNHAEVSTRGYVVTAAVLLVLAGLSLVCSDLPLGSWEIPVAVGIAAAKGALVLLVFMHLGQEGATSFVVVGVAVAFVALLIALTALDVINRFPEPATPTPRIVSSP